MVREDIYTLHMGGGGNKCVCKLKSNKKRRARVYVCVSFSLLPCLFCVKRKPNKASVVCGGYVLPIFLRRPLALLVCGAIGDEVRQAPKQIKRCRPSVQVDKASAVTGGARVRAWFYLSWT